MLNKIPKSNLKLRLPVFSQNWIHLSPKFKWVETGVLKYILKKLLVIWLTFYEKQSNCNLDVLKQDSNYSLWLDYKILLSSKSPGNHFCIFRPHYVIFPTLLQVWTVIVFKSGMIKWHILSDPGSRMHKMFLYFIYSSIWYITYVAYVHVREYSLTKTYTLLLKFQVKGKIFQRKKNITSYTSHQLAHLSSSPWRAWKLVQRKLVVGTFSYQGRHKEVSMATCKQ